MQPKQFTLKLFNQYRGSDEGSRLRDLFITPEIRGSIVSIAQINVPFSLFVSCWIHGINSEGNFVHQPNGEVINHIALKLKEK